MKPLNLLKIETLNDEWLDKDVIILHACFQILCDCIEKENLLNIEMKEYFTYSIAMIIEKWITIISVLFVGGIFKQTVQMMLFLFFFLLLRKRTGGYHASSFLHCYIETIIISIVVILKN